MSEDKSLAVDSDIKAMSDWMVDPTSTARSMQSGHFIYFGRYAVRRSDHSGFEASFEDQFGKKWRFFICDQIAEMISRQTSTVFFDLFPADESSP